MGDKGIQELSGAQQQQFSYWEIGDPTHQEIHYEVLCFPRGLLLRATSLLYVANIPEPLHFITWTILGSNQ